LKKKYLSIFSIFFCFYLSSLFGQEKFSREILDNPKKHGHEVELKFKITEVYEFEKDSSKTCIAIKNGLRSSNYINGDDWLKIEHKAEPIAIKIVFSKYPIRKHGYQMNHALLFNRLKNLFKIDPYLNDTLITWEIVLQTNCKNDNQVSNLFHGVVIEYKIVDDPEKNSDEVRLDNLALTPTVNAAIEVLEKIESFDELPQEIKYQLEGRTGVEKTEILIDYFEDVLTDTSLTEITPEFLTKHTRLIKKFIDTYGNFNDSIAYKVFERNTQWKNALIVSDWTGSMYQYGAQALLWHVLNFENSGIQFFTLFNDGDKKITKDKVIGKTEGVYFEKATNIDKLLKLYQLVILKGYGGDGPENDVEAILKGIEKYPVHSEVILIADNNACVRDMELLEFINQPVRVILCGYNEFAGINPQYLDIATKTGGSIHTIDMDIYNIKVKLNKKGETVSLLDYNYKVGMNPCYVKPTMYSKAYFESKLFKDIETAKKEKNNVINLDLSNQELNKIPPQIKKFKNIENLNLSNNNISKINSAIYNSETIETLDLSNNQLTVIPYKMERMYKLKNLNLKANKIDTIYGSFSALRYLRYCNLSENNLGGLPKNMNLRYLETLFLDHNKFKEIPEAVTRLRKLKELSLSGNNITKVSKKITYLKRLEVLNLSDNQLTELPSSIYRLRRLKYLILSGNNFNKAYIEQLQQMLPTTIIEYQ